MINLFNIMHVFLFSQFIYMAVCALCIRALGYLVLCILCKVALSNFEDILKNRSSYNKLHISSFF